MLLQIQKKIKPNLWVFDNDGTLYPNPKDLELPVVALMNSYIAEFYGIGKEDAPKKRHDILKKHSTKYTLVALRNEGVNENHFIQSTYLAIKPEQYGITQNLKLRKLIFSLKGEKIVMTNNPSAFADYILRCLGIRDLFSNIYGVQELGYIQKPNPKAYKFLDKQLKQGEKVVFIDDEVDNIKIAKQIGCTTVLAGDQHFEHKISDFHVCSFFWNKNKK